MYMVHPHFKIGVVIDCKAECKRTLSTPCHLALSKHPRKLALVYLAETPPSVVKGELGQRSWHCA